MALQCALGYEMGTDSRSADFIQQALRTFLQRAGGFGEHFLDQLACAFGVANGVELLR